MVFPELVLSGVAAGAVYGLVALGLVVVHSASNVVNFAQGSFAAVAVYVFIGVPTQLPLAIQIVLAVLAAGAVAGLVQVTVVSWASRFGPMNPVLATVAVVMIIDALIRQIWGARTLSFPHFLPEDVIMIGSLSVSVLRLSVIGVVIVTAVVFWLVMTKTSVGLVIRGTANNPRAAKLMGISPARISLTVWIVGGLLAGIAGILLGHLVTPRPEMGLSIVIMAFAGAVVGGFHSPIGALVGAVLLGVTESLSAYYIGSLFQDAVPLILLVLFLTFRPSGLLGGTAARAV